MEEKVTLKDLVLDYLLKQGSGGKPMSVRRFADIVGVSVGTIRSIIKGWYVPDDRTVNKLASVLQMPATDLYKMLGKLGEERGVTSDEVLRHRILSLSDEEIDQVEKFVDYLIYRRSFNPSSVRR